MFKEDLNVACHLSSPFSFIGMTLTRDRARKSIRVTMGALNDKLDRHTEYDLRHDHESDEWSFPTEKYEGRQHGIEIINRRVC